MAGGGANNAGSSYILSSAYNQPKIVEAYVKSTLDDVNFPTKAIQALQAWIGSKKGTDDIVEDLDYVQDAFEKIETTLSLDQKKALLEAIKALSLSISHQTDQSKNVDRSLLLGCCKILTRQWIEAVVDLDIIRYLLYSKRRTRSSVTNEDSAKKAYISTLRALQLASLLLRKKNDIEKYSRWIRQEEST